jgi:hypothetical protein
VSTFKQKLPISFTLLELRPDNTSDQSNQNLWGCNGGISSFDAPRWPQWAVKSEKHSLISLELASEILFNLFIYLFIYLQYWGLNSGPSPWATPPAQIFVISIFERGSCELFAQFSFKLQSSWSLLPK